MTKIMIKTKKTLLTLMFIFSSLSLITCSYKKQKIISRPLKISFNEKALIKRKKTFNHQGKIKPFFYKDKLINNNQLINNKETNLNDNNDLFAIKKNKQNEIINNNKNKIDYQIFLNEYNLLINYAESYRKQIIKCHQLINKIEQIIKQINNDELTNNYQCLITKIKHKQQWLTNNHLGFGYWIISFIQMLFTVIVFIWHLNDKRHLFDENIKIIGLIYRFLFEKTLVLNTQNNFVQNKIYLIPLICFLLMFIFNCLSNFDNYLANNIHYLFTKYSFNNNYSLPKHQACYFYYDHSTKMIINNEKYFIIPFLFTNNNHLITNIFDFILNLLNLTIMIMSLNRCFHQYQSKWFNYYYWIPIRVIIWTLILIKIFFWINTILIYVLNENNFINQIKLTITNFFKSLPIINQFYYLPKNNRFKLKIFNYLIPILLIITLLFFSWLIDYIICILSHNIRYSHTYCLIHLIDINDVDNIHDENHEDENNENNKQYHNEDNINNNNETDNKIRKLSTDMMEFNVKKNLDSKSKLKQIDLFYEQVNEIEKTSKSIKPQLKFKVLFTHTKNQLQAQKAEILKQNEKKHQK